MSNDDDLVADAIDDRWAFSLRGTIKAHGERQARLSSHPPPQLRVDGDDPGEYRHQYDRRETRGRRRGLEMAHV